MRAFSHCITMGMVPPELSGNARPRPLACLNDFNKIAAAGFAPPSPPGHAGRGRAAALGWSGLLSNRYRWPACTDRSGSGVRHSVRIFSPPVGRQKNPTAWDADNSGGTSCGHMTTLKNGAILPPVGCPDTPQSSLPARAALRQRGTVGMPVTPQFTDHPHASSVLRRRVPTPETLDP